MKEQTTVSGISVAAAVERWLRRLSNNFNSTNVRYRLVAAGLTACADASTKCPTSSGAQQGTSEADDTQKSPSQPYRT